TPDGIEGDAGETVNRYLVQLVERSVHPAGDQALDHHAAADEPSHQVADRGQLAQRYQRAEVSKVEYGQGVPGETRLHRLDQQQRLLARGLRTRRDQSAWLSDLRPRARGAVAECEHVRVARRLQGRLHHELVGAVDFKSVEIGEKRW